MGIASWLLIDTNHPGTESRIFVWMPATEAPTPGPLRETRRDVWSALSAARKGLPAGYRYDDVFHDGFMFRMQISGGDCSRPDSTPYIGAASMSQTATGRREGA
jgi:hypothetical protein